MKKSFLKFRKFFFFLIPTNK